MFHLRKIAVLAVVLTCFLQGRSAEKYHDEYTDEKRPYEFGFNIDGEQHRHEKKDEDGLIMGEFGFITADGVYHVTVYATDENGNFKILSMKNLRVKPYPTAPEKKALDFPPSDRKPLTQGPADVLIQQPALSCATCSIPTTKAPELTDIAVVAVDNPAYNQPQYPQSNPQYPPENYPQEAYPEQPQEYPQENYPENPQQYPEQPQQYPDQPQYPQQPQDYPQQPQEYPEQSLQPGERNPKQYEQDPNKPVLISAQMQIVDKNTDVNYKGPGETSGLPNGLHKQDMELLLYTFNYTVGFHGHYEEGYTNGYKKGYYFVTGRNGVRTRVDYEADDKGFRPKITQEVLDLISEDVPKEETEKDAKYGLKGYEFKWIYYPVESRRR